MLAGTPGVGKSTLIMQACGNLAKDKKVLYCTGEESQSQVADRAKRLVQEEAVLMLPGTMFQPDSHPEGARQFRIAFANVDAAGIAEMFNRLKAFRG